MMTGAGGEGKCDHCGSWSTMNYTMYWIICLVCKRKTPRS